MVIGRDNMSTFYEAETLANGHDLGQRSKIAIYTIIWYKNHIKFMSATRSPKLCSIILDMMVHIVKQRVNTFSNGERSQRSSNTPYWVKKDYKSFLFYQLFQFLTDYSGQDYKSSKF
jgi:hypothetical protein